MQRLLPLVGLRGGDPLDEIDAVVARQPAQAGEGLLGRLADGDHAHHDAAVAQPPRDGAGIDAADAGHPLVGEEGVERGGAQGVARRRGVLADDEAGDLDAGRLEVTLVDAVVADQGIGWHDDLAGEGGVGQHLLVAGHGGAEYDLAVRGALGAEGRPAVYGAVFED